MGWETGGKRCRSYVEELIKNHAVIRNDFSCGNTLYSYLDGNSYLH
jgi:hypothetical protein